MKRKLSLRFGMFACLLLTITVSHADEYDTLRARWHEVLTGGPSINTSDSDIAARLTEINTEANNQWTNLNTSPTRTYLWADKPMSGTSSNDDSAEVTENFTRIRAMAYAYATVNPNSTLYNNATLRADIISAVDFMFVGRYNATNSYGNWFDWEIASPIRVVDIATLVYAGMTPTQVSTLVSRIDSHVFLDSADVGANRVWKSRVLALRGIVGKDSAKITAGRNGLDGVLAFEGFDPGTTNDGFKSDGSFTQHGYYSYTAGYGVGLARDLFGICSLLANSTWAVTNSNLPNATAWVYDAFEPLMYRGALMEMTAGRTISRQDGNAYGNGRFVVNMLLNALDTVSSTNPPAAADFKSMVKALINDNNLTSEQFVDKETSIWAITRAKQILADSAVVARPRPYLFRTYSAMDRAVVQRQGWAFGLSLFSSRFRNYEISGNENLKGWHTGSGMTYLYTADTAHYVNDFWPTVDSANLPGTTIIPTQFPVWGQNSTKTWVGGAALDVFGVVGMDMAQVNGGTPVLTGKKSWFALDQEVVCLGADIDNTGTNAVYTVVENRQLNSAGNNAFTINGTAQLTGAPVTMPAPPVVSTPVSFANVNWAHLAGPDAASGIGYYFPSPATVLGLREARTGNWKQINNRDVTDDTPITRNYLSLRLSNGSGADDQSYAYTLLPMMTSAQVATYAAAPGVTILENSAQAQGVEKPGIGVTAINFWQNATKTVGDVTTSDASSFIMMEDDALLDIGVSDPTWTKTGTMAYTINKLALGVNTALTDTGFVVTQLEPTIQFTANVAGIKGRTKRLALNTAVIVDNNIALNTDGSTATGTGIWTNSTSAGFWGTESVNDGNTGKGAGKYFTFTPYLPRTGTYQVGFWYVAHAWRATNVPVDIVRSSGTTTMTVNQQINGSRWFSLGTHHFTAGTAGRVVVRTAGTSGGAGGNSYVVADAIRFLPVTLDPPVVVEVDNDNANNYGGSQASTTTGWSTSTVGSGAFYSNYFHDGNTGKGSKSVTFTPNLPSAGNWQVYVWHYANSNRSASVPIDINGSSGTSTVNVNQKINGSQWLLLGTYAFNAGTGGSVVIRNTGTTGYVVADGVRFVKP